MWFSLSSLNYECTRWVKIFYSNNYISNIISSVYPDGDSGTYRDDRGEDKGEKIMRRRRYRVSFKWGDYLLYALIVILIGILIFLFLKR